jgi:ubiquitin carboxyl-terminal hydrolase 10
MRVVGQPDIVTIEDWRRSLQLDIQVRYDFFYLLPALTFWRKPFPQPDSILTIQDALAYMSQPQSVQVSPSGGSGQSKATQQVTVLIEVLPPVLVLHLKRFVYNAATDDVVKIGKPIQFSPELEIPLGTEFLLTVNPYSETTTENLFRPGRYRCHDTHCRTTLVSGAIHALWSALPRGHVRKWRSLYHQRAPPERTQWWWRGLATR